MEHSNGFWIELLFIKNSIDTVRDINLENINEALARKMAIEIIEFALADIWEQGALQELQKRISEEEDNIIKRLKELKQEY